MKQLVSWENAEKLFRLFFPEFSNKVTWAVVIGGLALTSTSLLEKALTLVLERQFNLQLTGNYDWAVGLALVALGLTHNILLQREKTKIALQSEPENNEEAIEHDKLIFSALDEMLIEEVVTGFIDGVQRNHAFFFHSSDPIDKFRHEASKVKFSFVSEKIEKSKKQLILRINAAFSFFFEAFSPYGMERPDGNHWLCMHPYWNCDRGGDFGNPEHTRKYDEATDKLYELTNALEAAYKEFRTTVKNELLV